MEITFWGTRGSIATAGAAFATYGGNTTCVEVAHARGRAILDAGTGLRALGDKLVAEARALGRPTRASLLFTHFHWDHIQGFPFFSPAFDPRTRLELFGPEDLDGDGGLLDALERQMSAPTFPVPLSLMGAERVVHTLRDGQAFETAGFQVTTQLLDHPQGVHGYRFEAAGRSFVFATDVEQAEGEPDVRLVELARGADLLVLDAQYTDEEYAGRVGPPRKGWGHSTYRAACAVARAAGVKRLGLFHHDPTHDDELLRAIERDAKGLFDGAFACREGTTIALV